LGINVGSKPQRTEFLADKGRFRHRESNNFVYSFLPNQSTMKKTLFLLLALCLLVGSSGTAHTKKPQWGATGHRVVGHIAQQHLSKKAQKAVKRILGNESLAMAANWADFIKSDSTYKYVDQWHYVNLPEGKTYADITPPKGGDVVEAIGRLTAELKSGKLTPEKERFNLRLLVHFVGDVHQPMHVGRPEDRGGNDVKVRWFSKETNLHAVWDSDLIEFQQLSYTELAESINFTTAEQRKAWQQAPVTEWANESSKICNELYRTAKTGDRLSYRYNFDYYKVVEQRLLQAGVRLAGLLNEIFV
jgi:hypothetical protein